MATPDAQIRAAAYEVSCFPEDHPRARMFTLRVEHQGADLWAVLDASHCLNRDGGWDHNPRPDERPKAWISNHWFPLQRALDLAAKAAKDMAADDQTLRSRRRTQEAHAGGGR